jgi:glycosyltransferase involved in cell wall biosynthesis
VPRAEAPASTGRLLVATYQNPIALDTGGKIRMWFLVRALAQAYPIDLVIVGFKGDMDRIDELEASLAGDVRILTQEIGTARKRSYVSRAHWLVRSWNEPQSLALLDYGDVRDRFRTWRTPHYVAGVFFHNWPWHALGDLCDAPVVLDLHDIMTAYAERAADVEKLKASPTLRRRIRRVAGRAEDSLDLRRWRRFQDDAGRRARHVAVCSEVDQRLFGHGAVVIPNGFDPPDEPVGRIEVSDPPTVVFQGHMGYHPNADGATWLVQEVLPHLRSLVPGVQVVIAGRPSRTTDRLVGPDVTVTGWVPEMRDVLRTADLVAVPLRIGSGTRLKILEAWSNRIPVVSTTVGAEGLGAIDGDQLLLADSPEDFAAACAKALADVDLRARLVEGGAEAIEARFRWGPIQERFLDLVRGAARA